MLKYNRVFLTYDQFYLKLCTEVLQTIHSVVTPQHWFFNHGLGRFNTEYFFFLTFSPERYVISIKTPYYGGFLSHIDGGIPRFVTKMFIKFQ